MPTGLKRYQSDGNFHFITFSCYHRLPYLQTPQSKETFETILENVRQKHDFQVFAYVVMPEHIHLLVSEPKNTALADSLKLIKQETSKLLKANREHFWQARYYDFNIFSEKKRLIFSEKKRLEKLRYIHRNPVTRSLVANPEQYPWSSYLHYATGVIGTVQIESQWTASRRERASHPLN